MPHAESIPNAAVRMLEDAAKGGYGVLGVVSYNLETIVGAVGAAEAKRSPLQILLFPWAIKYSPYLVHLAANAARSAQVPVTVHLDHAQDVDVIKQAAKMQQAGRPCFDSIMIDMSHFERDENLSKTKELVSMCRALGIATEAEPGRIEGGEDGVQDTSLEELEGMMTTVEDVDDFVATGIDLLAPAFGNVHGDYHGVENIYLDYERLARINKQAAGRVKLVLHGTNEFTPEIVRQCVDRGVTRINVNKMVLEDYFAFVEEQTGKLPLTQLMERGTALIQKRCEEWMDVIGSSGRA